MRTTNRFFTTTALAAFLFLASTLSAFAKPTEVSKYLMKQFQHTYRHASNVTWKTTENFTSATFMMDGDRTSVFYGNDNNLIGVSRDVALEDLPRAARRTINTRYGTANLKSAIEFTNADGDVNYYVQLDDNSKQIILKSDEQGSISNFQK